MHVSKWPIFSPLFLTPIMYKKLELRKRSKRGGGGGGRNPLTLGGGEIPRDLARGGPNPWGGAKSLRHRVSFNLCRVNRAYDCGFEIQLLIIGTACWRQCATYQRRLVG